MMKPKVMCITLVILSDLGALWTVCGRQPALGVLVDDVHKQNIVCGNHAVQQCNQYVPQAISMGAQACVHVCRHMAMQGMGLG